jgi:hypothetical protein
MCLHQPNCWCKCAAAETGHCMRSQHAYLCKQTVRDPLQVQSQIPTYYYLQLNTAPLLNMPNVHYIRQLRHPSSPRCTIPHHPHAMPALCPTACLGWAAPFRTSF